MNRTLKVFKTRASVAPHTSSCSARARHESDTTSSLAHVSPIAARARVSEFSTLHNHPSGPSKSSRSLEHFRRLLTLTLTHTHKSAHHAFRSLRHQAVHRDLQAKGRQVYVLSSRGFVRLNPPLRLSLLPTPPSQSRERKTRPRSKRWEATREQCDEGVLRNGPRINCRGAPMLTLWFL